MPDVFLVLFFDFLLMVNSALYNQFVLFFSLYMEYMDGVVRLHLVFAVNRCLL